MRLPWKRVPLTLAGFPFFFDSVKKSSNMYLDAAKHETGWDRLRSVFISTDGGEMSRELSSIHQSIFMGGILGMMYGGIKKSQFSFKNFIHNNDATKFHNIVDARRTLQNEVTIGFIKGAYKYGWRVALFTGSYVGLTTLIATYRGRSSVIEYTVAGAVTGMMYKVPIGPRGMVSGGVVGAVLGTLAGGITLLILKTTGSTVEEVRYWQLHIKDARNEQLRESVKEAMKKRDWEALHVHNEKTKEVAIEKQLDTIAEEQAPKEKSVEKKTEQ
ncbi:RPII140-upstream gene protein [Cephus cinctus]|uniref:Complex I assembly factor TIMMDC1, mitochondrial n=1 Tax=Cephus cinctus TaxID=211228 RepID=A0AAJ7FHG4_CEPCN|nr:RPII140-upstream gene protein [Cephus cinctus]